MRNKEKLTLEEAHERYDDWLNEQVSLGDLHCKPFAELLYEGDSRYYDDKFSDYCADNNIEVVGF